MTIKFNGVRLPSWVVVTGISFQTLPTLDIFEYQAPRRVGGIDGGVKRGGSTIKLSLLMLKDKSKNIHQQRLELKKWAIGDNWKPSQLILDEQPNKYYMARVLNSMEIDDLFTHGKTDVEFYCADPIAYDVNETVVNSSGTTVTIDYKGLEPALVKIVINHPYSYTNLKVANLKTGVENRLINEVNPNKELIIDNVKKKVTIDGDTAMKIVSLENEWLYLENGVQEIRVASKYGGAPIEFKVIYRQAD